MSLGRLRPGSNRRRARGRCPTPGAGALAHAGPGRSGGRGGARGARDGRVLARGRRARQRPSSAAAPARRRVASTAPPSTRWRRPSANGWRRGRRSPPWTCRRRSPTSSASPQAGSADTALELDGARQGSEFPSRACVRMPSVPNWERKQGQGLGVGGARPRPERAHRRAASFVTRAWSRRRRCCAPRFAPFCARTQRPTRSCSSRAHSFGIMVLPSILRGQISGALGRLRFDVLCPFRHRSCAKAMKHQVATGARPDAAPTPLRVARGAPL